jgi:23S rRNA pseudouridine2605 synthase
MQMKAKPIDPARRLHQILAQAGLTSRRQAEEWIRAGRVSVDGQVVNHLGLKISPGVQRIEVDGRPIPLQEPPVYYLFYKPKGVLSTLMDPQGRPTLKDFISRARIRERVFPVGRLDWDAEGLMLLTNDGNLAQTLQHPKFQVPKSYRVKVRGIPSDEALRRLETGVKLPGGKTVHRAEWERIKVGPDRAWLLITIREGEKHQVKNMLAAVGHPVLAIKRVAMGPLVLGRLAPGELRPLSPKEVQTLKSYGPISDGQEETG